MIIDSIILDIKILIISSKLLMVALLPAAEVLPAEEVLLVEVEQTPGGIANSVHELPFMAEEH